ncbi:MAG TPA: alpha/beta fold hydrolase, partial [Pyrinomonadaceae bacterium]
MFVERHGRGPDVYFALHGWGGDRRTFAPLAPFVPEGASLYAADLPGCGDSPRPNAWAVGCVVDEVVRAVRSIEADSLTLVGNCGGAVFALLAARELGATLNRVSMVDPFAYLPRYFRLFNAGEFGRRAYDATFANPLGRWLTNQSLRGRRAGAADLTASFAEADHEAARAYLALY